MTSHKYTLHFVPFELGIVPIRGLVTKGTRIIAKGEVVEGEKLDYRFVKNEQKLHALKYMEFNNPLAS